MIRNHSLGTMNINTFFCEAIGVVLTKYPELLSLSKVRGLEDS